MSPERLLTIILAIAFLAAPPIALLYGPGPGLFVLAGALLATIGLAWSVRSPCRPTPSSACGRCWS